MLTPQNLENDFRISLFIFLAVDIANSLYHSIIPSALLTIFIRMAVEIIQLTF